MILPIPKLALFLKGGGLFAYTSQAVGNVMATGTGSYSNMSVASGVNAGSQGTAAAGSSRYNNNAAGGNAQNYVPYQSAGYDHS